MQLSCARKKTLRERPSNAFSTSASTTGSCEAQHNVIGATFIYLSLLSASFFD
jgi:hypothetical protein